MDITVPWHADEPSRTSVVFEPAAGTFVGSERVVLRSDGGTIHYTTDGRVPDADSPRYSAPLTLTESTLVRAVAIAPNGEHRGAVASYVEIDPALRDFSSSVPLVIIHPHASGEVDLDDDDDIPASVLVFKPLNGRTQLLGRAQMEARVRFNRRGDSSLQFAQKSYAVEFTDVFDDEAAPRPFVGLPSGADFTLIGAGDIDRSLIRNALGLALSRRIGRYAPRTRAVEAFVVDSGRLIVPAYYQGAFTAAEAIRAGQNRVEVASLGADDSTSPRVTGGYVFRIDEGENDFFADGYAFQWVYPSRRNMVSARRAPQREYLRANVERFLRSVRMRTDDDPYSAYIDVGSFIDHNLLVALAKNVDGLRRSAYFHKDRNGPIVAGPAWDFDRSFGTPHDSRAADYDEWARADATHPLEWGWYAELFEDPAFETSYWARWKALRCSRLTIDGLDAMVSALASEVAPVAARHYARFVGGAPYDGGIDGEINHLRQWLQRRVLWLDEQAAAASTALGAVAPK